MSKKNEENNQKSKTQKYIIIIILLLLLIILLLLFNRRYEVVFDENGGSVVDEVIVLRNHKVTEPKDPVREGYEFAGWYNNDELYDFSNSITKDIVLEARWVVKASGATLEAKLSNLSLLVGTTSKIEITSLPTDITKDMLTYNSSDNNIILVDKNGKITALKEGVAYVTVSTPNGESVKVQVTVTKDVVKVTGVSLNKTNLTLTVGDTYNLVATVKPKDATNKKVTWTTSNKNVVTVNKNGKITAVGEGTAIITVTTKDGNYKATCKVTVTKKDVIVEDTTVKVTGVSLNKTKLTLTVGSTEKLVATIKPNNATNKNITWTSSNPSIATVDSNGNVKALNPGTTTITVKTDDGGYTATCIITVNEKEPSYVITITKVQMDIGSTTFQHKISVTRDGNSFNDYKGIVYNGERLPKGELLGDTNCNPNITTATLVLGSGKEIKNVTVIYR